jgi:hypothetical protein
MLTAAGVERLIGAIERSCPSWRSGLRPGLTDDVIARKTASLGFALPEELRVWWSSDDGAVEQDVYVNPLYAVLSLDHAIDLYARERSIVENVWPEEVEDWWPRRMLPVFWTNGGALNAMCNEQTPTVTIHLKEHTPIHSWPRLVLAASLGDLVSRWAEAHECGVYEWDVEQSDWLLASGLIPQWNGSLI